MLPVKAAVLSFSASTQQPLMQKKTIYKNYLCFSVAQTFFFFFLSLSSVKSTKDLALSNNFTQKTAVVGICISLRENMGTRPSCSG